MPFERLSLLVSACCLCLTAACGEAPPSTGWTLPAGASSGTASSTGAASSGASTGGGSTSGSASGSGGTSSGGGSSGSSSGPGSAGPADGGADQGAPFAPEAGGSEGGGSSPAAFRHPGALLNGDQITFLKAKVAASADPWTSALAAAKGDSHGSLSYMAHPPVDSNGDVGCGAYSNPDIHCKDEQDDSAAAYTDALVSALAGDMQYAAKAIEIMNAWSAVMKTHSLSNAPLQSGWTGTLFARAAELIRYTTTAWAPADIAKFSSMLQSAYLPYIQGSPGGNGNWELSMADALIQIAVFLDDHASFDHAVSLWKTRVPEYIYMTSDGAMPLGTSSWNGTTKYFDGLCQETCRDLGHTQYGFAAMINAAETARIQGVDLYSLEATRITTGLELHAGYLNARASSCPACGLTAVSPDPMWEIAYNEYANRLSTSLPNVAQLVSANRPTAINHHMAWETLTHAEVGSVGIH